MLQSCSIEPNMMGAPWLDVPSKITESELSALEANYESMLETIRNDTFGGVAPPKYDAKQYNSFIQTNQKHNNQEIFIESFDVYDRQNASEAAANDSIHVFNDNQLQHEAVRGQQSGLDISFHPSSIQRRQDNHNTNNTNNRNNLSESMVSITTNNNLLSYLEFHGNSDRNANTDDLNEEYRAAQQAFDRHEINLSAQRVRLQLNMTNSPSLSPIPHSNDSSMININLSDISRTMHEYKTDELQSGDQQDERRHDISLPFMSPSMLDVQHRHQQRPQQRQGQQAQSRVFLPSSISPPIFSASHIGHTQSEQPLLHNNIPLVFPESPSFEYMQPQINLRANNRLHSNSSPLSIAESFSFSPLIET